MTTPPEIILETLNKLGKEEFHFFKWCLYHEGVLGDFTSIPKSYLEDAERFNTVDQMVQTYGTTNAIGVTEMVLKKINRNDLVPKISRTINEGVSEVKLQPNTADTESDPEPMEISSTFTPEMQTESRRILYRFRCNGPGVFRCAKTGLVFMTSQGAELQYSIVQWDESLLKLTSKEAAGPLYDIRCSDAGVFQIHFPHCETKDALSIDGLLSVAHFTENGMNILNLILITGTHVVVEITRLSLFGLILDPDKRRLSRSLKGQVLLFLRPPIRGPPTLDVFLLQKNIPPSQVAAQRENAEYIAIQGNCSFIIGRRYSLHCEQEGVTIQPECENFNRDLGPHFHPTFEVFLGTNPDVVTLTFQNQEKTDVWKLNVYLKDPKRDPEQRVQPEDWLSSVWTQLIEGLSEANVSQILDRLFQEKVFNAQERDVIRAQIGADKARKLINWVHRKGPGAVSFLKDALCEVDPFLFLNLA